MITGNEPINIPTGANGSPFFKAGIDKDAVENQMYSGLTIRQHFAAINMNGMLASFGNHDVTDFNELASDAVKAADALIAELNKTTTP